MNGDTAASLPMKATTASFISLRFVIANSYLPTTVLDFFNQSIYFHWRIIALQYCDFFLPYIDMNQPRVSICPPAHHPEALPSLPPHHTPLHCPRALALNALLHASNLHWSSILYMVRHMFQCYSLNSPHPRLLPQSPKVCSCTSVSLLRPYM